MAVYGLDVLEGGACASGEPRRKRRSTRVTRSLSGSASCMVHIAHSPLAGGTRPDPTRSATTLRTMSLLSSGWPCTHKILCPTEYASTGVCLEEASSCTPSTAGSRSTWSLCIWFIVKDSMPSSSSLAYHADRIASVGKTSRTPSCHPISAAGPETPPRAFAISWWPKQTPRMRLSPAAWSLRTYCRSCSIHTSGPCASKLEPVST
mmetsp:Transcript_6192/g.24806  ORF Transcript_6192/g.24806 Transcript_6192/m.24806 type:complete len:206 (+) Transcript_6192:1322-1939(+)